jgi:hypothetical protein
MKIVNDHLAVRARLVSPNDNGYLLLGAEIGAWRGPFLAASGARRELVDRLTAAVDRLTTRDDVEEATVFRAVFRPPGEGDEVLDERGLHPARYDVVVLIRTTGIDAARALREDVSYKELAETTRAAARRTHEVVADNAASLGAVDHNRNHLFLFNYFYADDRETLLGVWEYTAGWFQAKTGLANSTLLRPLDGEPADYGIINHASWPRLRTFLPSLLFRPTFRSFVLANFKANGIAAQPIIYRLA